MDRGAGQIIVHGVTENQTRLSPYMPHFIWDGVTSGSYLLSVLNLIQL